MKVFLSIGTGPGIGFATAERFARAGFRIILSARSEEKTQALARRLREQGFEAEHVRTDASNTESVCSLIDGVLTRYGQIDVFHYNAAVLRHASLQQQPVQSLYTDIAVNISGALAAIWAVEPAMEKAGGGTVLLTGGHFGIDPNPEFITLSVGKAGIRAIALALFTPMKSKNIHVGTVTVAAYVSPGSRETQEIADRFMLLHQQAQADWVPELVYAVDASHQNL